MNYIKQKGWLDGLCQSRGALISIEAMRAMMVAFDALIVSDVRVKL
jgi:hypothetical protein